MFGLERSFHLDLQLVEQRYYEISQKLHPDRFVKSTPEIQKYSLDKMSFVNVAYKTLTSKDLMRLYILDSVGLGIAVKALSDQELNFESKGDYGGENENSFLKLASEWFEIHEAASDDADLFRAKKTEFSKKLQMEKNELEENMESLETMIDSDRDADNRRSLLRGLKLLIQRKNYVESLQKELQK